ncbi:transposase family protein, partial [Pseudonocardia sp. ICBG601]|uniref:transposase family protein n=1 Tax=Pseudonocardia sp. ICBG601 TaxID=2846759 RepID=UPI0027E29431
RRNPTALLVMDRQYQVCGRAKHRTTGVVVQVAATLEGQLSWISDPTPGSRHDLHCPTNPAPSTTSPHTHRSAIKATSGRGMLTPFTKNNPAGNFSTGRKPFNKSLNRTRATIERVIAHIKSWGKFSTQTTVDPTPHFKTTISAVIGLIFYALT